MVSFSFTELFSQNLGTNAATSEVLASIILFVIVAAIGWVVYYLFNHYFSRWVEKTATTLDDDILDIVKSFVVITVVIVGIEFALTPLSFVQPYIETVENVFFVVEVFLIAFAITKVSNIIADWYANKSTGIKNKQQNKHHLIFILKKVIQIIVYLCAIIIVLWVRHVDLTGALVGLGVGGIAIAFALQSTLSDFFSAFAIYFDRPFEIGDSIAVGEFGGIVQNIGIRSTRIKLLSGEELVVSNKELTTSSIRNFRKLEKRRVTFSIGVTYDTPSEKLKKIPLILRGIIENTENTEIERVHFTEFGDFALKFLISYYVKVPEYSVYLDIQQGINFAIKDAFEREGIEMALPTSTVYVRKEAVRIIAKKETYPIAE